jgi:hypothetical protein
MLLDMSLIDEAEFRGYIQFNEGRSRISYLCGRKYTDNFNDPEEKIRAAIYAWLILDRGYPANRIEVEYTVPRRTPSDRADIVVFMDDRRTDPYLVVEAKLSNRVLETRMRSVLHAICWLTATASRYCSTSTILSPLSV